MKSPRNEEELERMEQQIGFCATSDGATVAYTTIGDEPPLVYGTGWPGHLAAEWEKSVSQGFLFSDNGESELRGFEDPVRLFDVSWQWE